MCRVRTHSVLDRMRRTPLTGTNPPMAPLDGLVIGQQQHRVSARCARAWRCRAEGRRGAPKERSYYFDWRSGRDHAAGPAGPELPQRIRQPVGLFVYRIPDEHARAAVAGHAERGAGAVITEPEQRPPAGG